MASRRTPSRRSRSPRRPPVDPGLQGTTVLPPVSWQLLFSHDSFAPAPAVKVERRKSIAAKQAPVAKGVVSPGKRYGGLLFMTKEKLCFMSLDAPPECFTFTGALEPVSFGSGFGSGFGSSVLGSAVGGGPPPGTGWVPLAVGGKAIPPRKFFATATAGSSVFVSGGIAFGLLLGDLFELKTSGAAGVRWIAHTTTKRPCLPRSNHGMAAVQGGSVYIFGGCGQGHHLHADLLRYDSAGKGWVTALEEPSFSRPAPPAPCGRMGHSMCATHDGRVVVLGGVRNAVPLHDAWLFDPADPTRWRELCLPAACPPLVGASLFPVKAQGPPMSPDTAQLCETVRSVGSVPPPMPPVALMDDVKSPGQDSLSMTVGSRSAVSVGPAPMATNRTGSGSGQCAVAAGSHKPAALVVFGGTDGTTVHPDASPRVLTLGVDGKLLHHVVPRAPAVQPPQSQNAAMCLVPGPDGHRLFAFGGCAVPGLTATSGDLLAGTLPTAQVPGVDL